MVSSFSIAAKMRSLIATCLNQIHFVELYVSQLRLIDPLVNLLLTPIDVLIILHLIVRLLVTGQVLIVVCSETSILILVVQKLDLI